MTTIILVTALLAAVNGANDNIKGAATLLGSGVAGYRTAIALATLATAAGGMLSIFLANGLLAAFSGKGIVPAEVTSSLPFLVSVGVGAALTVGLATGLGLPISTTHALLGGLVGAGFGAAPSEVHAATAFREMLLPLLVSPAMALALAFILTPLLSRMKVRADAAQVCACLSSADIATDGKTIVESEPCVTIAPVDDPVCSAPMTRQIARVDASVWIDRLHLASAAAVSFARGLNDTPKIAALMVAAGSLGAFSATTLVVVAMAIGGWLAARRVANTLAYRVTRMDPGAGLAANLVTSLLVIGASRFDLPVSTTHVSAGALFGIAATTRSGHWAVIRNILMAWLLTLPIAALCAYASYVVFR